jgi:hypothetical protein
MTMKKSKKHLTETQVDEIVTRQADDESAWEEPIHVAAKPKPLGQEGLGASAVPNKLA